MRNLFFVLVTVLLLAPTITLAQDNDGLVPCGRGADDPCTTDHVTAFASGIIEFLFTMLGVIAVIAMVYAGFRMLTSAGNESEWGRAKAIFTNVVIGIIIILASWLVVDTVLDVLTGKGLAEWSNFEQ